MTLPAALGTLTDAPCFLRSSRRRIASDMNSRRSESVGGVSPFFGEVALNHALIWGGNRSTVELMKPLRDLVFTIGSPLSIAILENNCTVSRGVSMVIGEESYWEANCLAYTFGREDLTMVPATLVYRLPILSISVERGLTTWCWQYATRLTDTWLPFVQA